MKTTAFLIFYAEVLIILDCWVLTLTRDEREGKWKTKGVKEVPPPHPNFPLLTLSTFSSFSLPALNFPYLQAFSQPNRLSSSERVKATKTKYAEVTRRQTVHPVCYTAYETKAPCLPYAQSDFHDDVYDNLKLGAVHDGFNLNEIKKLVQPTSTLPITPTETFKLSKEENKEENIRTGKYLELKLRRYGGEETTSRIEGSDFFPVLSRVSSQLRTAEDYTKTLLITKLEKYTDRRVTATLLAVNCLPVDRSIPMCHNYPSPIREAPDRRFDEDINFQITHGSTNLNSDLPHDKNKLKSTFGTSTFEPEEINTEKPLLGIE